MPASVTEVAAYRTVADDSGAPEVRGLLEARAIDWLTFTSSSTAEFFLRAITPEIVAKSGARIASIGPATSAALRKAGLEVAAEADVSTAAGLAAAIVKAQRA